MKRLKAKERWQICAMVACLLDGSFTLQEIHNDFWMIIKDNYEEILLKRDASVIINSDIYQSALAFKKADKPVPKERRLASTPREKMNIAMWLLDRFEDKDEAVRFVQQARVVCT